MRRLRGAPVALGLVALVAAGCATPALDNAQLEDRIAGLEERLVQLEERLASVPDSEGLEEASPEELVLRLGREDIVTRYRAVSELAKRQPEDVQQALFELLASGHGQQREGAAAVLALKAWPEAASELSMLHAAELEPRVRALLALAVGRTGGPAAADALIPDLQHDSRTVRLAAVQALDRLEAVSAAGRLLIAAMDADVHVASAARGTLQRLPESAFQFVSVEWEWMNPRKREAAIEIIGTLPGERSTRFLRERVADPEPLVALAAAAELASRGDATGRDLALQRLGSDDPAIARAARLVLDALSTQP